MAEGDLLVLERIDANTALLVLSEVGPGVNRFPARRARTNCWRGFAGNPRVSMNFNGRDRRMGR
jgi:hypothetical protein